MTYIINYLFKPKAPKSYTFNCEDIFQQLCCYFYYYFIFLLKYYLFNELVNIFEPQIVN